MNTLCPHLTMGIPNSILKFIHTKKVAEAKTFCRNREIEYNLHLETYSKIHEINYGIRLLREECSQQKLTKLCNYIINDMIREIGTIQELSKIFEFSERVNSTRKKRFIDKAETDLNERIAEIIQNSITLFDYGYNDLRNNTEEIRKHMACFTQIQNNLNYALGYVNFNSLAQVVWNSIRKTKEYTEKVIGAVTNKKTNKWTSLVPLWNLRDSFIQINREALKENCTVPIPINEYFIHKYLKISTTSTLISGNILKVRIKVPTYTVKNFEVYYGIPLPFKHKKATYVMSLNSDYYLIRRLAKAGKVESIPMTTFDYKECKSMTSEILCHPSGHKQILRTDEIPEISNLFIPDPSLCDFNRSEICDVKTIQHKNSITKLEEHFFYIYIVEPMGVKVKCDNIEYARNFETSQFDMLDSTCVGHPVITFESGKLNGEETIMAEEATTILQNLAGFGIGKNDLLSKEILSLKNMSRETRDLQPDFLELKEDISKYKNLLKEQAPLLKLQDSTLSSILGLIFVFFVATWIAIGYVFWLTVSARRQKKSQFPLVSFHKEISPDRVSFRTEMPALNCNIERTLSNLLNGSTIDPIYQDSPLRQGTENPFSNFLRDETDTQSVRMSESPNKKSVTWNVNSVKTDINPVCSILSPTTSVDIFEPTNV